ncbi:MAG: hypothetical protein II922_12815 [Succinimonas sp.]|nr:hypothetical protein [Succinimonas sp.]
MRKTHTNRFLNKGKSKKLVIDQIDEYLIRSSKRILNSYLKDFQKLLDSDSETYDMQDAWLGILQFKDVMAELLASSSVKIALLQTDNKADGFRIFKKLAENATDLTGGRTDSELEETFMEYWDDLVENNDIDFIMKEGPMANE